AALDDEMVSIANEAIDLLAKEHQTILNTVYGLYQIAAEDRQWMKAYGVPRDLSRSEVVDYISSRFVSVWRAPNGRAKGSISMRVMWDDEPQTSFSVRDGRLVLE